jgi:16S rRNA (guanine1207-N2)-methyltransferase
MSALIHGLYGSPKKELAPILAAESRQFSPLVPGSSRLEDQAPRSLSSFTLQAPPGTIERRYTLALALRALSPSAPLLALGLKDKGGSRLAKELRELGLSPLEEAKSHHKICRATAADTDQDAMRKAIEEGSPRLLEELGLWSQPGVFSWDRLDPGSSMLAEALPELSGRGADLGCGLGFLSKAALRSSRVTHIELVDIDRRAVECARRNLERDAGRASVSWLDLRSAHPGLQGLDFVVTNPPFHDEGTEDQTLGQGFIQQAAFMLRPGGHCWLVANRHLPYEALLRTLFQDVALVREEGGYKIYRAAR